MKLTKKANGKYELTVAKSKLEEMRKEAKWDSFFKKAMPVDLTDEQRRRLAEDNLYVLLEEDKERGGTGQMPKTNKSTVEKILREEGMVEMFSEISPKTILQLPKIYKPNYKNIVNVEGQDYYLAYIKEPSDVNRASAELRGHGYVKDNVVPGKIVVFDIETGAPRELDYDSYIGQMRTSPDQRRETLTTINENIRKWNEKVETIEDSMPLTTLNLQIAYVEEAVNNRLQALNGQVNSINEDMNFTSEGYQQWIDYLVAGLDNGDFSDRDALDTVLFIYKTTPAELVGKVENGEINLPASIQDAVLRIAQEEVDSIEAKRLKDEGNEARRQERIDAPTEEDQDVTFGPLGELRLQDIPEKPTPQSEKFHDLRSYTGSIYNTTQNIRDNIQHLETVNSALSELRGYIANLPAGARSDEFISAPEGEAILTSMEGFLERAKVFIRKYSVDIIKNGTINNKLMSQEGDFGNALIGIQLFKIFNVIKEAVNRARFLRDQRESIPAEREEVGPEAEMTPEEEAGPTASKKHDIKKMSETLWDSFKKRRRLR
jgi:hypothetical protein